MPEPKPPQHPITPEQSMEAVVWSEIKAIERPSYKPEARWTPGAQVSYYMNNFYTKLPTTSATDIWEHGIKNGKGFQTIEELFASRSEKWKDKYSKPGEDQEVKRKEGNFSKRRWEETQDEFYRSIEQAIDAAQIDPQELREYITYVYERPGVYDSEKDIKLILPVYIKLREMGYTHRDLSI